MLEKVLQAAYMIMFCRAARVKDYAAYHPVDAMVGEMDWVTELNRLRTEEITWGATLKA